MAKRLEAAGQTLTFANGNAVTLRTQYSDDEGECLVLEHRLVAPGALNGPHRHPVLQEKFTVIEGAMRFRIDRTTVVARTGEHVVIRPMQVHQAWKEGEAPVRVIHEIRPPGFHWTMFKLLHKLESEGKLNARGIPKSPLWMGVAWLTMDGYIAGPPRWAQRIVFGGLAKLALALGYKYESEAD